MIAVAQKEFFLPMRLEKSEIVVVGVEADRFRGYEDRFKQIIVTALSENTTWPTVMSFLEPQASKLMGRPTAVFICEDKPCNNSKIPNSFPLTLKLL